ncbi:MAG: flagellar basal body L-ring protein FlgH [Myxococcales bacterium]|nr:flagellar basal body L-ring protein FlgH [Myxococcales bacterium]MCB9672347.1 flagellar basal body L-ring protein FlgH [Alphaproteobacteria bacterium]
MITLLFVLSTADARRGPAPPPPIPPVVVTPPAPPPGEPGSLWREVNARQLMGMDGNARQVGDLITVRIEESLDTQVGATTNTRRRSSVEGGVDALAGLLADLSDSEDTAKLKLAASLVSEFSGQGETKRGSAMEAILTCEVIEILPNGNLRIWGYETLRLNRETQYLTLEGTIRPRDIQMDNTVRSDLVARPVIQVTGSGVVADKQGPGWLMRLLDALWPF